MSAIGMNEFMSIPTGMFACDAMLKAADVELVSAGCVCAGKYYIVVAGEVAAVRSAVEAGREVAENLLIDSLVIPNVDLQVAPAISACTMVDRLDALGIMETYSLCAAVYFTYSAEWLPEYCLYWVLPVSTDISTPQPLIM